MFANSDYSPVDSANKTAAVKILRRQLRDCRSTELDIQRAEHRQHLRALGDEMKRAGRKSLWLKLRKAYKAEIKQIIYACYLAGISYGLSPVIAVPASELISEAVRPIESNNLPTWLDLESSVHQAGEEMEEIYADFDMAVAVYKGYEQDAAFLHGLRYARSFAQSIFR